MITEQLLQRKVKNESLKEIYEISLQYEQIKEISNLEIISQIRSLNLSWNQISKIENLRPLQDLRELILSSNQISVIQNLEDNKLLMNLQLASNQIQRVQNIGHLNKLQKLNLKDNVIAKFEGLDNLKDLRILDLSRNQITKISHIQAFNKLEEIYLNENQLTKIDLKSFENCTCLTILELQFNKIKSIGFLVNLKTLIQIRIDYNEIEEVPKDLILPNLETFNISNNKLTELRELDINFPNLYYLDVSNNELWSAYELSYTSNLDNLIEVDFTEHEKFIKNNPNLEVVNGEEINKPATKVFAKISELEETLREQFPEDAEQFQEETKSALADLNFQGIMFSNKYGNKASLDSLITSPNPFLQTMCSSQQFSNKQLDLPPKQFEILENQEKFEEFLDQYESSVQELKVKYLSEKKFLEKKRKTNQVSECSEKEEVSEQQQQIKNEKMNERFKGQFLSTLEEKEAMKQSEKKVLIKKKVLKSSSKPQKAQNKMYCTDSNFSQQTTTIETNENYLNSTSTFQDFHPNNKRNQLLQLKTEFQKYKEKKDDELFTTLIKNTKVLNPQNYNPKSILKAVSQQKYLQTNKIDLKPKQ